MNNMTDGANVQTKNDCCFSLAPAVKFDAPQNVACVIESARKIVTMGHDSHLSLRKLVTSVLEVWIKTCEINQTGSANLTIFPLGSP